MYPDADNNYNNREITMTQLTEQEVQESINRYRKCNPELVALWDATLDSLLQQREAADNKVWQSLWYHMDATIPNPTELMRSPMTREFIEVEYQGYNHVEIRPAEQSAIIDDKEFYLHYWSGVCATAAEVTL